MKIKVADFIIKTLANHTDYCFQVYGSASASLVDAFHRYDKPKFVCGQHEAVCGFMSEGYSKVTGKIGVTIVTSGPGATNAITAMGNMFYDSVPGLFLTGQVHSKFMRPHEGIRQRGFQETDIVSMVKGITKYAVCLKKAEDVRYELEKAIHLSLENRQGPVLIDCPLDILQTEVEEDELIGYTNFSYSINPQFNFVDLENDLNNSKKPAILIGGGVKRKHLYHLNNFLNRLKIPVFPTYNALDIVCDDNPYFCGRIGTYGGAGRNFGIQNCDLLIAIGTRISGRITGGNPPSFAAKAKKYLINIDKTSLEEKYQEVKFDKNILCDAEYFCSHFSNCRRDAFGNIPFKNENDWSSWLNQCKEWKNKYDCVLPEYYNQKDIIHPYVFTRILSQEMSKDDILAVDCGGNLVCVNHSFETKTGQIYITNNGFSPMGGAAGYGMGAKLADPNKNVITIIGDGGMMISNLNSLQTILDYDIRIKLIILNNGIYGITGGYQKSNYESRHIACGLGQSRRDYHPCDFIKVGQAIGIDTMKLDKPIHSYEHVRIDIKKILNHPGPLLVDVRCDGFMDYLPKIKPGWDSPIERMIPELPLEEQNSNMI